MNDDIESARKPRWYLITAGLLTFAVMAGLYVIGALHFRVSEWDKFGGFIGGAAGTVLTALTFLALLYTIHIQSTELSLSRQELRLTREEMAQNREELSRSAAALNQQVDAVNVQNFERTLFDSLRFLNDVVVQFEHKGPYDDQPRRGAQAFVAMQQDMSVNTDLGALGTHDGDQVGSSLPLNQFLDRLRPLLGTYFRTLYNVYRYLDESAYSDRVYYNRIIRAQIPDHALSILFYNSLTHRGQKFQKYIVKFRILDNLANEYLLNQNHVAAIAQFPTPAAVALEADSEQNQ